MSKPSQSETTHNEIERQSQTTRVDNNDADYGELLIWVKESLSLSMIRRKREDKQADKLSCNKTTSKCCVIIDIR